jgi:hypothetical protein
MQLQAYLTLKGLSPDQFAERLTSRGVPTSTFGVRKWIRRERIPRAETLHAIREETEGAVTPADFFDTAPQSEVAAS